MKLIDADKILWHCDDQECIGSKESCEGCGDMVVYKFKVDAMPEVSIMDAMEWIESKKKSGVACDETNRC